MKLAFVIYNILIFVYIWNHRIGIQIEDQINTHGISLECAKDLGIDIGE